MFPYACSNILNKNALCSAECAPKSMQKVFMPMKLVTMLIAVNIEERLLIKTHINNIYHKKHCNLS